ncbi:MAG: hypothetical protein K5873_05560 [Treponema sp.]|nr:hypothetical protein [Treponema sp.]
MSEKNWYEHKEKTHLGYELMLFVLKFFPAAFMRFLAFIVGFFYWLFDHKSRKISKLYLKHYNSFSKEKHKSSLAHICSFALNLVENLQSWAGKFSFENVTWQGNDIQDLVDNVDRGQGCLLLLSHLGNSQLLKGLASLGESGTKRKLNITSIMDSEITAGFGALQKKVNPDSDFHIISTNKIRPETIFLIQERLEKGELVVIAGDRISAHSKRYINLDFMGANARFPYGVFLLISLLNVPTYFVNGLRHKDISLNPQYDMYVKKNPLNFECSRKEREERILQTAKNYVQNLEELTCPHPYQWYNFFDFWA